MKYIGCDIESNRSIRYDPKVYMERKTCREHPSLRDLRSEPKSRSGVGGAGPLASTRQEELLPPLYLAWLASTSTVPYGTVALVATASSWQ